MKTATTEKKLTPVIGLEIHVQLKTDSKMFCSCSNDGENQPPNTTVCEICMGHPGTLPVANRQAVEWAVKTAMSLNCELPTQTKFDRKNYFYPDLPKGYQISQYDQPIGPNGRLEIETPEGVKLIRITRLHLEEDAAKNFHSADGKHTLVDYNRAGTPLMEIVTEPDIRSARDAKLFMQELRLMMRYLGVSEADMEKGHLRCDANISLTDQPADAIDVQKLHPKTEIKNLNSFRSVERAIEYEIRRQTKLWEEGAPPSESTTRGWDEEQGVTEQQRIKEESHDYRYFPEPDLPPISLSADAPNAIDLKALRDELGETPAERRVRFIQEYDLPAEQVRVLVDDKGLADFFENVLSELRAWLLALGEQEGTKQEIWERERAKLAKLANNWLVNKLLGIAKKENKQVYSCAEITPENFAEFITMLHTNRMNATVGLKILEKMLSTGKDPSVIAEEGQLGGQATGTAELEKIVVQVIADNPKQVEQYKAGKATLLQFFVGQVMRQTKGQADPQQTAELLTTKLNAS